MAQEYRVVISGRTLSGGSLDEVRAAVGQVFRLQGEQLDRMLCGKPVVVLRNAPLEAAGKLQAKLQGLGLEAVIEPVGELAAVAPPKVSPNVATVPALPGDSAADELFALTPPSVAAGAPSSAAKVQAASSAGEQVGTAAPVVSGEVEVVCPKCGEGQPKRTLCRQCGLDMPRYLAAQQTAEREAREQREQERELRQSSPGRNAGEAAEETSSRLFGIGFSGRLGRLDYFSGSILSSLICLVFVVFAALTGKLSLLGFGLFVSFVYGLRCIALRLHDTGRTGWLSLVALVPVLGGLMAFLLLFAGGEDDDNEYGAMPAKGGGRRALVVLLSIVIVCSIAWRGMSSNPEKVKRLVTALSAMQGKAFAEEADDEDDELPEVAVTYASNNRVDIYVTAGCSDCDEMRGWLSANGLHYTLYSVDSDQHAAERLHSIIPGGGSIQLPVLEVNGRVLPGNPPISEVHRHLRQAPQ